MLTISEICKKTGKKKAAVSLFLSRNKISAKTINGHYKYFDESVEPLASYIGEKPETVKGNSVEIKQNEENEENESKKEAEHEPKDVNKQKLFLSKYTPLNDGLRKILKRGKDENVALPFIAEALSRARNSGVDGVYDIGAVMKLSQMLISETERDFVRRENYEKTVSIAKIKQGEARIKELEYQTKRGELIERTAVIAQWGRVAAVITKQIHPIGIKLSKQVCAVLKISDTNTILEIQKIIDDEIYAACKNVNIELEKS
ncbi:MAG: hypothetical protein LBD20_02525 [Spirochaetaceae bacterium]|jgi:hypothetical protein|nr:hypothetical protein [Spirochaetaceae bacterium]